MTSALTAVLVLALVACAGKRAAGDSSAARNANQQAIEAAGTAHAPPANGPPQTASTSAPQKDTPAADSGGPTAEIVWRNGTVTKGDP